MKIKNQTLRWIVINNGYKCPQTRTIHMQEKATEEVTTVPQKHWKMCLVQSRNIFNKTPHSELPETFGCPFARGEQHVYSPHPAGFRKVSQKWWCKTTAGRSQCVPNRDCPAPGAGCEQVRERPPHWGVCTISHFTLAGLGWSTDSPLHWSPCLTLIGSWLHCSQHEIFAP